MKRIIFILLIGFSQSSFSQTRVQQAHEEPKKLKPEKDIINEYQFHQLVYKYDTGAYFNRTIRIWKEDDKKQISDIKEVFNIYSSNYNTLTRKEKATALRVLRNWVYEEEKKLIKK